MVAKHRIGGDRESFEQLPQPGFATRTRNEITGDDDEVEIARGGPVERALNSSFAAGRHAEMEVGQMKDAKPREGIVELRNGELEAPDAQPACLEPTPTQRYGSSGSACEPASPHSTSIVSADPTGPKQPESGGDERRREERLCRFIRVLAGHPPVVNGFWL